jgi:hypothetical protein
MLIHEIIRNLKQITADTPVLSALLPGGLGHGARMSRDSARPFGLLRVEEIERVGNTANTPRVGYRVTLTIVADQRIETVGPIMNTFRQYWDRLTPAHFDLPNGTFTAMQSDPDSEPSEIGEDEREDLGADVILGITSWTLKIAESQPAI